MRNPFEAAADRGPGTFVCLLIAIGVAVLIIIRMVQIGVNPALVVFVDGNKIYSGSAACVDVKSAGDNTRVDVYGGFLCALPRAYYVSKNVRIENVAGEVE